MNNILIDTKSSIFGQEGIAIIEKEYKAKYIFESCVRTKSGWVNNPAAIFYTEEAHPQGSNYFAMYKRDGTIFITDGITATEPTYVGIAHDGVVTYSRYRHDFRTVGDAAIDGGRDYCKINGSVAKENIVRFKVVKDILEIVPSVD